MIISNTVLSMRKVTRQTEPNYCPTHPPWSNTEQAKR